MIFRIIFAFFLLNLCFTPLKGETNLSIIEEIKQANHNLPPIYTELKSESKFEELEQLIKLAQRVNPKDNPFEIAYAQYTIANAKLLQIMWYAYKLNDKEYELLARDILKYAQLSADIFKSTNPILYERSIFIIGYFNFLNLKFQESEKYFEELFKTGLHNENKDIEVLTTYSYAIIYEERDLDYYNALKTYEEIVEFLTEAKISPNEYYILDITNYNIGELYALLGNAKKANNHFNKSMHYSLELKDTVNFLWTVYCSAEFFIDANDYDQAKQFLDKTNSVSSFSNNTFLTFGNEYIQGYLSNKQGDTLKAIKLYNSSISKAYQLLENNKNKQPNNEQHFIKRSLTNTLIRKAQLAFNNQQWETCDSIGIEALTIADKMQYKDGIIKSVNLLEQLYLRNPDIPKPQIYTTYKEKNFSIIQEKEKEKASKLFAFEQKMDSVKIQNKELVLLNKKQKINHTKTFLTIGVIMLVGFYLIYTLSKQIVNERKNKLLLTNKNETILKKQEELEKELQDKLLYYAKQKELLETLDKSISSVQSNTLKFELKSILRELNDSDIFESVEQKYIQLNKTYVDKLLNVCPSLTPNNLLLCIFIKSGLNSKEIAEIRHISADSVKVARTRLRKKLNLESKESLFEFLHSIRG